MIELMYKLLSLPNFIVLSLLSVNFKLTCSSPTIGNPSTALTFFLSVLDLDYNEDSAAEIDANFVMTADDQLVEVQATGEVHPFSRSTLNQMLDLASAGCGEIFQLQQQAVRDAQ